MRNVRNFLLVALALPIVLAFARTASASDDAALASPSVRETAAQRSTTYNQTGPSSVFTTTAPDARLRLAQQLAQGDRSEVIAAGNPVVAPLKWNGLWTTQVDASRGLLCTAQFIAPRIILLAAHCVRNQNGDWYDVFNKASLFLLQWQNENFSKLYRPLCKVTPHEWVVPLKSGEDPSKADTMTPARKEEYSAAVKKAWQYDIAFVYLDADSITGHYNVHVNEHWNGAVSVGYPGDVMGGKVLQLAPGDVFDALNLTFSLGSLPNTQVLWQREKDFTQGASGGAWVANFSKEESANTNIIIGLNSFVNHGKPGAMFGPFFTDQYVALAKAVESTCQNPKNDPKN